MVTTLFRYPSSASVGRQTQTWLRTAVGWRIIQAHVSSPVGGPMTISAPQRTRGVPESLAAAQRLTNPAFISLASPPI